MSNCQTGEGKDQPSGRKRKAEDRPPAVKSSSSTSSSTSSSAHALYQFESSPSRSADNYKGGYPFQNHAIMWDGYLHLKNDKAAVQMLYVSGSITLARKVLPPLVNGQTSPLKITQRLKLEPQELYGVNQKLLLENEHCILVALPCGIDKREEHMQSRRLKGNFISYFENKQAAGIVNVTVPEEPGHVIHMFPSCEFTKRKLKSVAPRLLDLVVDVPHLVVIITTLITAYPEAKPANSSTPAPSA